MGCQSAVEIGNNLTFSITTHDPDTGILTDADAAPIYRIYEDETAVPILTGTMAALDAINTTGFYTELIACTTANGFEDGRSYTIYIEATVDADTGGISYGFTVYADFLTAILEGTHTVGDSLRIMLAALAGRSTGGGTFTNRFRDVANIKNRIDATVDANGNRTAITIDGT